MGKIPAISLIMIFLFVAAAAVRAQTEATSPKCGYDSNVLDPLVNEAEQKGFAVRRIEISGSTYTGHRTFVKRMVMDEGDLFTRANLERTVRGISRMKEIYPIKVENVEVRLDRDDTSIDILICVIQKPR
jgi:outer membrane protein assembly factor BamA